ncbi:MAG TPA: hypothetical protein DIW47_05355 [Bacteroidetes bacterium]|nr:hypothetical protein [Bacteroidota bacterium]
MNLNKYYRSLTLFVSVFCFFIASAQMEIQKGIEGKTFYDSARTEVHEAYEYKLRYTMIINPKTGHAEPLGDPEELKNGVYIRYRKDGTMYCSGYFRNDVKCGEWKFMDATGKVTIREENFGGECVIKE